jgi:hypothetical protein
MLDRVVATVVAVAAQLVLLARWPLLLVCVWQVEVFILFWPGKPEQLVEQLHLLPEQT